MDRPEVAIVIPAFNEAQSIAEVVSKALSYGAVIVVDDASIDGTSTLAIDAGAQVVVHSHNKGYDGALNSGFAKAAELACNYVITFDADGQHDASLLLKFIDRLKHGVDLVIGVRPKATRLGEHMFSLYTRWKFGIRDPLCGMKGYQVKLYKARGCFDSYQSIGTELMLFGLRHQYTYEQFEVPIVERRGSTPRFGGRLKANWKIFRALIIFIWRSSCRSHRR